MITPFTLRDLRLLGQLQKVSVSLCLIETLTRPQSPLWTALTSLLPFDEDQSVTFVLNEQRRDGRRLQGFIQARHPRGRPRMYVQCLTPRLDADEDAHAVWNRLTNHLVATAGEQGIQRVFACAADGSEEMIALLGAGFNVYTREDVFRLAPRVHLHSARQDAVRPEQSTDRWDISRLYRAITPHLVQQAESPVDGTDVECLCGPMAWSEGEGLVLDGHDGIVGYGHLTSGRVGHWLNILVHSRAYHRAGTLLDYGLALLNHYPPYPVYCAVREYQGGVRALLQERGFDLFSGQCRLVRHTTGRVKEPARGLVPGLEKRVEAPTAMVSPTEGH